MADMFLLAVISAFTGYGFSKTLEPGMIFYWYYKLLLRLEDKNRILHYVANPLGLCILCNTTWIGFICALYAGFDLFWVIATGMCSLGLVSLISYCTKVFKRYLSE